MGAARNPVKRTVNSQGNISFRLPKSEATSSLLEMYQSPYEPEKIYTGMGATVTPTADGLAHMVEFPEKHGLDYDKFCIDFRNRGRKGKAKIASAGAGTKEAEDLTSEVPTTLGELVED